MNTRFLRENMAQQSRKVEAHELEGRRVWLKLTGPANPFRLFRVLAAIMTWLGLGALRPVDGRGGAEAIAIEARRLRELRALGLPVPQLLASTPCSLLLSDLGDRETSLNLHQALAMATPTARQRLMERALAALDQVHRQGGYLSQAFARNLIVMPDGRIGFIDFEEDPRRNLSLADCQARDLLCLIYSVAFFFTSHRARRQLAGQLQRQLARRDEVARTNVLSVMRRLQWLRHLPASPHLGKDTLRVQATGALFHDILRQARRSSTAASAVKTTHHPAR